MKKQFRIFISSVQDEFAAERKLLKKWLTTDPFVSRFVERVFLFEDVPSRGKSPVEVFLDEVRNAKLFKTHTSFPVNDLVLKTFDFSGLIESLGTGIKRMMDACKKNRNPIPEFRQDGAMFVVTLKKRSVARRKKTTPQTTQQATQQTKLKTKLKTRLKTKLKAGTETFTDELLLETVKTVLQGNSLRIALMILQNPTVKIEEIVGELEISRGGVNYLIGVLKKTVGLRRVGGRKLGRWEFVLPKRLYMDSGR